MNTDVMTRRQRRPDAGDASVVRRPWPDRGRPLVAALRSSTAMTTLVAMLIATLAATGCGTNAPAVGHRTAGLKHAVNADTAYRLGRFGVAAQRYRTALIHLRAADDQSEVARALHNYGMSLKAAGQHRDAIGALSESARLHRGLGRDKELALNLLAIAECQHQVADSAAAAKTLLEARQRALQAGQKSLAARAVAGMGAAEAAAGRTSEASKHYAEAAKWAASGDDPGALALVSNNRGRLRARAGDHSGAAKLFLQAAAGFREARDGDGLASALSNAAASMKAQGAEPVSVATLYQRSAFAAASVRRYHRAAISFAAAAQLFDSGGKTALARQCRASGRQLLDALKRRSASPGTAQRSPPQGDANR